MRHRFSLGGSFLSAPAGELLTLVEIEILAFTVFVLLLLSSFSARSFTRDARGITDSFERETRALLSRSEDHWRAQTSALETAISKINEVANLEARLLEQSRQTLDLSTALLAIERARDSLREEEARLRKQRIKPAVAISPRITHPGPIRKDIGLQLFNQGGDARRVAVTLKWGQTGDEEQTSPTPRVSAFGTADFGFGNIDNWPDSFQFWVVVEADDEDGSRFRWRSTPVSYSRNRGLLGSDPTFNPSDWQYPATEGAV